MKLTIVLATLLTATAAYADTPAGAEATGCDITAFVPVLASDGSVAYWNIRNDLCPSLKDDKDDKVAEAERQAAK